MMTDINPTSTDTCHRSDLSCSTGQDSILDKVTDSTAHMHCVHSDDAQSIAQRLQVAATYCQQNGLRFTTLRQQIYQFILEADKPIGAYELLGNLQQARLQEGTDTEVSKLGKQAKTKPVAPPTVYRTLEFLLAQGFIHQLTSVNAFVPCCHPRDKHSAAFLICERCGQVQECSSLPVQEMLGFAQQTMGFAVSTSVLEMSGQCRKCQNLNSPTTSEQATEQPVTSSKPQVIKKQPIKNKVIR